MPQTQTPHAVVSSTCARAPATCAPKHMPQSTCNMSCKVVCFCRHIVLAVRHPETGRWGAIGLSRRAELMDKPLIFSSLADLLAAYVASYRQWWHTVLRLRIGLPVPHDVMYDGQVGECRLAPKAYLCSLTHAFWCLSLITIPWESLPTICCQHILMFITQPKPEGQLQKVSASNFKAKAAASGGSRYDR